MQLVVIHTVFSIDRLLYFAYNNGLAIVFDHTSAPTGSSCAYVQSTVPLATIQLFVFGQHHLALSSC